MTVLTAHKIRLCPNNKQANYFARACGVARSTFNWGLEQWQRQYEAGEKPTANKLKKQFNAIKKEQFPWTSEVTKCAAEQAFTNLGNAFSGLFRNVKAGKKPGYPRFKKKGKAKDSFYLSNDQFHLDEKRIHVPKLGWVKMREDFRFTGKILSATISRTAGRWFVAIQVEIETPKPVTARLPVLGVDVGITTLATVSDGRTFSNPRALGVAEARQRLYQKSVSRKKKGSKNREKAKTRLRRLYERISCVRKDAMHKATTAITTSCSVLGIEDLNVTGMLKNHRLAKALADASFGEFFRQIEYKAARQGVAVVKAGRFYPSSKTCSGCGEVKDQLLLSDRIYRCGCGLVLDRDLNAARNLQTLAAGSAVSACCLGSSGA